MDLLIKNARMATAAAVQQQLDQIKKRLEELSKM